MDQNMDAASIHWPMGNQGWGNGNRGKGFNGSLRIKISNEVLT